MNTIPTPTRQAALAVLAAALPLAAPAQADADPTLGAARPLIEAFAAAADRRDVAALETLLDPRYRIVFNQRAGAPTTQLDRDQYLQMLRDGKLGGKPREVAVKAVTGVDGFAAAVVDLRHDTARFQSVYSLVQRDQQWWLLQETVLMTPLTAAHAAGNAHPEPKR